jgi:hypothetical protein
MTQLRDVSQMRVWLDTALVCLRLMVRDVLPKT